MKIREILRQHRRDFYAVYECEHCGATQEADGYDDTYFHQHVIPEMKCPRCGKAAPSNHAPRKPLYPDGMVV